MGVPTCHSKEEVHLLEINETAPGDYVLTSLFTAARTGYSTYSEITFTVLETISSSGVTATVPIIPSLPTIATIKGQIVFDFAKVQSAVPAAGGEMGRMINLCVPEITICADGTFCGTCEKLHIAALLTFKRIPFPRVDLPRGYVAPSPSDGYCSRAFFCTQAFAVRFRCDALSATPRYSTPQSSSSRMGAGGRLAVPCSSTVRAGTSRSDALRK